MRLFIAPHPDDIALSIGATLSFHSATGERVHTLTLFAADPPAAPPDTPIVRELHARWGVGSNPFAARREEDRAALQKIGADRIDFAPLHDAIYRTDAEGQALYPTGESIFGAVHPDDPAIAALDALPIDTHELTHLYVPLGVGGHVDHIIAREWGIRYALQNRKVMLLFYEDYPYAEQPYALDNLLGGFRYILESLSFRVRPLDIDRKIEAIRCYESQLNTFWESDAAMESAVRAFMEKRGNGDPRELTWYAVKQRQPQADKGVLS